ncbi:hypothetical protein QYE76_047884 [Lolium multiflorum]|uniref:Integrase catalytic domain-containing protein n=1 Tax=Lolium multiflorum TaxID=4521 RepID=A0AAD8TR63_LOLMU|nr:hypothetical protein QYE76_047884 [Lolium multiflorum]
MVDKFTKWIETKPTKKLDGSTAVTFLKDIIRRYGYPHSIITDNGTNFAPKEFKAYCTENSTAGVLGSIAVVVFAFGVDGHSVCSSVAYAGLSPASTCTHTVRTAALRSHGHGQKNACVCVMGIGEEERTMAVVLFQMRGRKEEQKERPTVWAPERMTISSAVRVLLAKRSTSCCAVNVGGFFVGRAVVFAI